MATTSSANALFDWAKTTAWALYEAALMAVRVIYIWGPPGVGKSFVAQAYAKKGGSYQQVTMNEDLSVQELMGLFSPSPSGLLWIDGPLTRAARLGEVLIINEAARASQAVLDFLLGLIDSSDSAAFTLPNGDTVKPHSNFRVVLSANEPPTKLDPALVSRLDCVIEAAEPHPDLITRLNAAFPRLGNVVAKSFTSGNPINPRHALAFAERVKRDGWTPEAAALASFGPERCIDIHSVLTRS